MKKIMAILLALSLALSTGACAQGEADTAATSTGVSTTTAVAGAVTSGQGAVAGEVDIVLSDSGVTVDGTAATDELVAAVHTGAGIVYYLEGQDETYGEGTEADGHSAAEAAAHTVVTITQPGVYRVSGTLSQGQLAVDLGEGAAADPDAVVTLILDGLGITCTVAPAVIFYSVYECGVVDEATASCVVDTTDAGANVIIADGSESIVNGSYVARIYKEGTTKKLHKYDGAFYSKMSMNVSGGQEGTGVLRITAENEGLDSELHLTVNGGNIYITADNDGINTNEDNVSVTTINGGYLYINGGNGIEGDGIDSNGYLTINGGTIITQANHTADGGIDADLDITINGGTVLAIGGRNDAVAQGSEQVYIDLTFAVTKAAGSTLSIRTADGEELIALTTERMFRNVTFSSAQLAEGVTYHIYLDDVQQQYTGTGAGMSGFPGGGMGQRPDRQEGEAPEPPEGFDPGQAEGEPPQLPEGQEGERPELPEGFDPSQFEGQRPEGEPGQRPGQGGEQGTATGAGSVDFTLTGQARAFSGVGDSTTEAVTFSDVGGESPYYSQIRYVARAGIMNGTGDGLFSPDAGVSRGMMVTIFGRMEQQAGDDGAATAFSDVAAGTWYSPYVGWASENGIVEGYSDGRFAPEGAVTRQEACLMLYRYAQLTGHELEAGTLDFSDSDSIADWAAEAIASLQSAGLLAGLADEGAAFSPAQVLSRGELALLIYNLSQN